MNRNVILLVLMLASFIGLNGQAIFDESFEGSTFPPYGWTNLDNVTKVAAPAASGGFTPGAYSAYMTEATQGLITPKMANPYTLTVWAYQGGNGLVSPEFYASDNVDGPWTLVSSFTNISNNIWNMRTVNVNQYDKYLKITFRRQGAQTAIYIDGITITPQAYTFSYRTIASGDWSNPLIWEYSRDGITWYQANIPPTFNQALATTIRTGHTVTLNSNATIDEFTIEAGGVLNVASGSTLSINNGTGTDMVMNGTLNIFGNVAYATGTNSTAGSSSTVSFRGSSAQITGTGFPPTIQNLIINSSSTVSLSANLQVNGLLTMTSGTLVTNPYALTYGTGASLLYNGTNAQTASGEWLSTMTINITNNNTSAAGVSVVGNKTYNTGTFTNNGNLNVESYVISGTGVFINNDTITSDISSPVTTTTFTQSIGSTIDYSTDVTLPSPYTYQNLVLSTSNMEHILGGNITVNETFSTANGAYLNPNGHRMYFPFKYVSVGGFSDITAFDPETYVEAPNPGDAVERKWTFVGASSGETTIYLHWDNNQDDFVDFSNGAKIWRYTGDYWQELGVVPGPVPDGATRMMVSFSSNLAGKADFAGQYAVSGVDGTLPVELSSFTSTLTASNYVRLMWITQSETNCSGYTIYRGSSDVLLDATQLNAFISATNTSQTQSYIYEDKELYDDGMYYYWLANHNFDGTTEYHGPVSVNYTTNGGNGQNNLVPVLGISRLYPNPFNPDLAIEYGLPNRSDVKLEIFNTRGQLIREWNIAQLDQGRYTLHWDGKDARGQSVPSGAYLIRFTGEDQSFTQKAILAK